MAEEPAIPQREPTPIVEDPAPIIVSSSRSGRAHRRPKKLLDFLPTKPNEVPLHLRPLPAHQDPPHTASPEPSPPPSDPVPEGLTLGSVQTEPNVFGLYRVYAVRPLNDPDEDLSLDDLADSPNFAVSSPPPPDALLSFGIPSVKELPEKPTSGFSFAPFLNMSIFLLMSWFYNGSGVKSVAQLDQLVNEVLLKEDFKLGDLKGSTLR